MQKVPCSQWALHFFCLVCYPRKYFLSAVRESANCVKLKCPASSKMTRQIFFISLQQSWQMCFCSNNKDSIEIKIYKRIIVFQKWDFFKLKDWQAKMCSEKYSVPCQARLWTKIYFWWKRCYVYMHKISIKVSWISEGSNVRTGLASSDHQVVQYFVGRS